jgi:hypothetical protein
MFVAADTVPVTVTLSSMSNGALNSSSVTCMVTVAADVNPHDMIVNASTALLPGREGQVSPMSLGGTADVSQLTGPGGGVAQIAGRIQPNDFGGGTGQITFTDSRGSVTLNLRGKGAKHSEIMVPWTYRVASATGAYSRLKKLSGRLDVAQVGALRSGSFFVFHL